MISATNTVLQALKLIPVNPQALIFAANTNPQAYKPISINAQTLI